MTHHPACSLGQTNVTQMTLNIAQLWLIMAVRLLHRMTAAQPSRAAAAAACTENAAPALCYVVDINYFPGECSNKDLAHNTGA